MNNTVGQCHSGKRMHADDTDAGKCWQLLIITTEQHSDRRAYRTDEKWTRLNTTVTGDCDARVQARCQRASVLVLLNWYGDCAGKPTFILLILMLWRISWALAQISWLPHHHLSASGSDDYHLSLRVVDPTSRLNVNRRPWSLTQLTLCMVRLQFSYFVDRQGFPDYSPDTSDLAPATYHFNSWNRALGILVDEMGYPPEIVRNALPVLDEGYCTVTSCVDSSSPTLSAVLNQ